jgi:hypothetical protein
MITARSDKSVSVKSEPQEPSTGTSPSNTITTSLSLPEYPDCYCEYHGQTFPVAEQICQGLRNPTNRGRLMYVCAGVLPRKCKYFRWKDEVQGMISVSGDKASSENEPNSDQLAQIKQEPSSTSSVEGTADTAIHPGVSNLTPSTSPQAPSSPPPRPTEVHHCKCNKIAELFLCRNGRPENINKWFWRCSDQTCNFWIWDETEEDAQKRINSRKRKASDSGLEKNCYCGVPAIRLTSRNGMPHNHGKEFLRCARRKCKFWIWADGSLPFSDESQARFDEWADGIGSFGEIFATLFGR